MRMAALAGAGLALLALAAHAAANPQRSVYTTIDLKECRKTAAHADGNAWLCPGLEGYPVYVADGDQRMFVSVGAEPEKRKAAEQTLGAFNTLFRDKSERATLEWRVTRRDGLPVPYATIQRYFTSRDSAKGEVLVVTRVTATEDCHVAYIDALANSQPIVLARSIADQEARSFDCKGKPKRVGKTGRSPM